MYEVMGESQEKQVSLVTVLKVERCQNSQYNIGELSRMSYY